MEVRPIESADDAAVAAGIRSVYAAYGCVGPGYSPEDPEMNCLAATYTQPGHGYFVAVQDDAVVGGCGYGPFGPSEQRTCELRKLFLLPAARGQGWGERLMVHTLAAARAEAYQQVYLETVVQMNEAVSLYQKHGFQELDAPLFGGGHHSCDRWFARALSSLLLLLVLGLGACSGPRVPAPSEPVDAPALRHELITMQLDAADLREDFIEKGVVNLRLSDVYAQRALYRKHCERLKEIMARFGWPTYALVGRDGVRAAADIAMYADHDDRFQAECLDWMQRAWQQGEGDGEALAELTDRVRIAQQKPQVYGTQARLIEGRVEFYPIEQPATVDQRRARLGLGSLAAYRRELEKVYLLTEGGR